MILDKLIKTLFFLFIISFLFEPHYSSYVLGFLFTASLAKRVYIRDYTITKYQFISIFFFLYIVIYNLIFWGSHSEKEIIYYLALILFTFNYYNEINIKEITYAFLGVLLIQNTMNYGELLNNLSHHLPYDSYTIQKSLVTDRPYNSLFIAVFTVFGALIYKKFEITKQEKIFIIFSIFYLSLFYLLFFVRFYILMMPIVWFSILLIFYRRNIFFLSSLFIITLSILYFYSNTNNEFIKGKVDLMKRFDDPRTVIWHCAIERIESSPIWGSKELSVKESLNICFKSLYDQNHNWSWVYRDHFSYDCHNQYLNFWLRFGLFFLLLFVIVEFYAFSKGIYTRNLFLVYFLLIFSLFFLIESGLERHKGLYLYLFLFNFLLANQRKKHEAN